MRRFLYQSWWKYLGILIMLYVLIAGFLVPLRPGVVYITPYKLTAGQTSTVVVQGYNTHFDDPSRTLGAWLKLDSAHILAASSIDIIGRKELQVTYDIPNYLPTTDNVIPATLVISDSQDGYMVTPSAFAIDRGDVSAVNASGWDNEITAIDTEWSFSFPFRSILYETIRNTFFHVAIWFAMFILLIVSLIYSIKYLRHKQLNHDAMAAAFTHVAVYFGILGVATGSVWAKNTWGVYWTNDPKLNMSAVALMIYMAYSILRGSVAGDDRRAQISAAYNIFAFVAMIPLIFVIPRMTSSLHPGNGGNPALGGEDLDSTLRMVFYPAIIGLTLIGTWIASLVYRLDIARIRLINKQLEHDDKK